MIRNEPQIRGSGSPTSLAPAISPLSRHRASDAASIKRRGLNYSDAKLHDECSVAVRMGQLSATTSDSESMFSMEQISGGQSEAEPFTPMCKHVA